jgi:hypothetical protein
MAASFALCCAAMALHPDHLAALIDVRVAELRVLAAQTAAEFWRTRPTLVERCFPHPVASG